jgi:type III secretion system low calcium response chaperone LcrH/SycD
MAVPDLNIDTADLQRATEHVMVHGGSIAEVRGVTPDELEAVYSIAYTEYGQQHYDKAEALFRFLCTFDHRVAKYWIGLGATRQEQRQWQPAMMAYVMAGMFDAKDPVPALQTGDCLLALGNFEKAEVALKDAVHRASQDPKHAKLKARAEALLKTARERAGEG